MAEEDRKSEEGVKEREGGTVVSTVDEKEEKDVPPPGEDGGLPFVRSDEHPWLEKVDNSHESHESLFNNNNSKHMRHQPYQMTFTNDICSEDGGSSSSLTINAISESDIRQAISDDKRVIKKAICDVCGREFESFTEREYHFTQRRMADHEGIREICMLPWRAERECRKKVWFHISESFKDSNIGVRMLLESKSSEIQWEKSMLSPTLRTFSVPLHCSLNIMQTLYFAGISSFDLEMWMPGADHLRVSPSSSSSLSSSLPSSSPLSLSSLITAPSEFVSLSDREIHALQTVHLSGKSSTLARDVISALRTLEKRLDSAMSTLKDTVSHLNKEDLDASIRDGCHSPNTLFEIDHCFAKLSTRSPKDASGVTLASHGHLSRVERIKLSMEALKVSDAVSVTGLLSRSARIFADLCNFTRFRDGFAAQRCLMNVVLRGFFSEIDPSMEFRCFIKDRRLNGISQYLCYDSFSQLGGEDENMVSQIRQCIVDFYAKIKDDLPFSDMVMDVWIRMVDPPKRLQCFIVEINPFGAHSSSGAGLFHWDVHYDVLYGLDEGRKKDFPIFRVAQVS